MQAELPSEYLHLTDDELCRRVAAAKARLGESLCILGHHYQRDEVVQFADFVGDSLKLSQAAAAQRKAKYVVFCGVHFMAESADILTGPEQAVILPNLNAGCSMADMADEPAVATALEELAALGAGRVVPVVYVNSTAAVKALAARAGGACCTSSNARNVFAWALAGGEQDGCHGSQRRTRAHGLQAARGTPEAPATNHGLQAARGTQVSGTQAKVFAIPDQHLGRNTAVAMGFALEDCALYDPARPNGGLSEDDARRARFFLWKGQCHIHQVFRPSHVEAARRQRPGVFVIVHPECPREVVAVSDAFGSTEQIIRAVAEGKPGSAFAVGTESNLVERLARRHPDRIVRPLADFPAICRQMYCVDLPHLLWVLENLLEGRVVNRIRVDPALAADARVALQRMVEIPAGGEVTLAAKPG